MGHGDARRRASVRYAQRVGAIPLPRGAETRAPLWRLIEHLLPPPDRGTPILDLGGGTGVWAIRLAEAGHRVTMVDIAPGYLARAREKIAAAGLTELAAVEAGDICDLSRYATDA
ncbi:class I SAM-dependent methyltransferase [Candidatus Poribacteria bacterium]|nr:class I SAM-dependent methyltransferase [Candidatus Poribacteria bacterium]MBT5532610.1 class I SAM-dependent methyltransferase [Candidatus Poribacteria bacterium]MBT5712148.1 class I SAM-dependent methyltransferase [Candidatus Poribacteria bacterium]MBT7101542.1 class I SAM-dependent methyltransferase [Candidatus Poribacteria bacterium]MBT7806072.1 class I SAM-dependent methyltransferase [Candidatus Poribacteria bacterium]